MVIICFFIVRGVDWDCFSNLCNCWFFVNWFWVVLLRLEENWEKVFNLVNWVNFNFNFLVICFIVLIWVVDFIFEIEIFILIVGLILVLKRLVDKNICLFVMEIILVGI